MNRSTRLAISAAVIGLALGLVTGLPPWPERTVMVTISLLLLAAAAFAAMWALLTIHEGLVPEPAPDAEVPDAETAPDAPATARIHHLDEPAQLDACDLFAYRAVADVPAGDPETAFEMSQNLESPWAAGDGVNAFDGTDCRSTSVGDVIEIAGTLHIVRDVGFGVVGSFDDALEEARSSSFFGLYMSAYPEAIRDYFQQRKQAS